MGTDPKAVIRGHSSLRAVAIRLEQNGRDLDSGNRNGRPAVPSTHVQALQDELRDYLEGMRSEGKKPKQEPECLDEVWARIVARGWQKQISRVSALRKVVQPVHRTIWPK
jgi:hypothetical protein